MTTATIHIHNPPSIQRMVHWHDCPDCKKHSPIAVLAFEWYGPSSTCMRCGLEFGEEGWISAPLKRGWRKENIDTMRKAWKRAGP
jgi:hypothetical protein